MNKPFRTSLRSSFRFALEGLQHVIVAERNARIHLVVALIIIALGLWLGLTPVEWAIIIITITLVFAGEMLNTVVELLTDLVIQSYHPLAKRAKDVAAGTILFASMASVVVGLLILGPPLWAKINAWFG